MINAAETHFEKLQLVQNQAMRIMMKSRAYVSVNDLHNCTGLPRIKSHLIEFVKMKVEAMKRASPIIWESINAFTKVRHILENSSILDVIGHNQHGNTNPNQYQKQQQQQQQRPVQEK